MKPVIIDTDPGIDDIAALLLALGSPELEVIALTTIYGNSSVDTCTANALRLLNTVGKTDIPLYRGAVKPLLRPANVGWASHIHGADGLGGVTGVEEGYKAAAPTSGKHAALAMVEMVMDRPGEVAILALGRMTNLALALTLEPEVASSVREIVVMGGAVTVPGNVSQVATANLHEDPEAASILYQSGAPIVQVGLDVCNQVTVSPAQLEAIGRSANPGAQLLTGATAYLRDAYIRSGRIGPNEGIRYNDMPAVGFAAKPEMFTLRTGRVEIEARSELTRGQTVVDWQAAESNARICMAVDSQALTGLFTERVSHPAV